MTRQHGRGPGGSPLTISHDAGLTEVPLIETTIGENLRRTVEQFGGREALVDVAAGRRWTYTEFRDDVRRLATGLHRAGMRKGQLLGIWGPNTWEWTLTQYATAELGVILVNINPAYRQHELSYVLKHAQINAVIASDVHGQQDYPGMLDAAEKDWGPLDLKIIMDSHAWDELFCPVIDAQVLDDVAQQLEATDPINIQYTSGTTGFPKGATLSHRNILNNGFFVGETNSYTEADRICIPVPFYHCFGMVMGNLAATSHGAAMIIPGPTFNAETTLRGVQDEQCTSLYGVPTMFTAELGLENFAEFDLSSLRTGIMAGSPCPAEIMRQVIETMNMEEVTICYGMTETSPVSTQTRPEDSLDQRVSTVGRVNPHVEVKIIDPVTDETLPVGSDGELCTRGYLVMSGYWNDPEKTAEAIDDHGWMHSGDMAQMDADGYVRVTGRMKDMVIRGGENIYPREIEEFLYTHPDVIDAQVIGVPDDRYGEELMAWVHLRHGAPDLSAGALRDFCIDHLAKYKIPRYVLIVDEFPTTVTGKVRKAEMRNQAVDLMSTGAVDDFRSTAS